MEKLGIMHVSSMVKKAGHQTCVVIFDRKQIKEKLSSFKPDIVGFQCTTGMQNWVYDTAKFIKEEVNKNILIIVGGAHPTFFPEMIDNEYIDLICRGEGEYPALELLGRIDNKKSFHDIQNLWVKADGKIYKNEMRPLVQNLDVLPFPDRELYKEYSFVYSAPYNHFVTSRGCAYNCTFCYNHIFRKMHKGSGPYVRRRSRDNIIAEVAELKEKNKLQSIIFLDDNFNLVGRNWFFSFLDEYKQKINLPYFCCLRADSLDDEMVRKLKETDCYWIEIGLEAGNERYRNEILKKDLKDEAVVNAAQLLNKHKIGFNTTNMIGLPNETLEDAIQGIRLNARIKPKVAWYAIFQPYPKTELGEYCLEHGLVDRLDRNMTEAQFHTSSSLKQPYIKECENLHKFAHIVVKLPILLPLVKMLIKLPPNRIFVYLQRFTYLIFYHIKYNRISLKRTIQEAVVALQYYRHNG